MSEESLKDAGYTGKQQQILQVAEELFAEHGFDGTSFRDIAHAAGVNVAMISYYFGSKEKLLHAVFNFRVAAGRLVLETLLNEKELDPLEKIDVLVETMVDRMMNNRNFHRVMLRCQLTNADLEIAKLTAEPKRRNLELVNKIIQEGQRKKIFAKGIDAGMLLTTIVGTVYQAATGSAYLAVAYPDIDPETAEGVEQIKKKLKTHLKRLLKAILTYEGK